MSQFVADMVAWTKANLKALAIGLAISIALAFLRSGSIIQNMLLFLLLIYSFVGYFRLGGEKYLKQAFDTKDWSQILVCFLVAVALAFAARLIQGMGESVSLVTHLVWSVTDGLATVFLLWVVQLEPVRELIESFFAKLFRKKTSA